MENKPYEIFCVKCLKYFNSKIELNIHKKLCMEWICKICKYKFKTGNSRGNHYRKFHGTYKIAASSSVHPSISISFHNENQTGESSSPSLSTSAPCNRLLWEFLKLLLNDRKYSDIIEWKCRDTGVFKIVDPAGLAKMWGIKKNHSSMNYDKMARALRYYCQFNILRRVKGERYCYKFLLNQQQQQQHQQSFNKTPSQSPQLHQRPASAVGLIGATLLSATVVSSDSTQLSENIGSPNTANQQYLDSGNASAGSSSSNIPATSPQKQLPSPSGPSVIVGSQPTIGTSSKQSKVLTTKILPIVLSSNTQMLNQQPKMPTSSSHSNFRNVQTLMQQPIPRTPSTTPTCLPTSTSKSIIQMSNVSYSSMTTPTRAKRRALMIPGTGQQSVENSPQMKSESSLDNSLQSNVSFSSMSIPMTTGAEAGARETSAKRRVSKEGSTTSLSKSTKRSSGGKSKRNTTKLNNQDDTEASESQGHDDDPKRLWCICRQPHNNIVICCDACMRDWFHGTCVNVTKASFYMRASKKPS